MKGSESIEPEIEVKTSLTKTSYTNLTCPQKEKPRVTDLNEDCNPNGSVCQDKVLHYKEFLKKTEPSEELTTANRKYYWSLEYLEYDSEALVIDYSSSEE